MRECSVEQMAARIAAQLPTGVLLCAGADGKANVMTVGWGGLAYFWRRHVFVAPIRPQRHTYPLVAQGGVFTISVPNPGGMQREIGLAGTLSGRDGDKFQEIGLTKMPARQVDAPLIAGCGLYLECVVRARTDFTQTGTDADVIRSAYPAGDFHTLFFGEIVDFYAGDAP